jgi:YVTN family beta-propeller protein
MRQTNLLRIIGQIAGFLLVVMCAASPSSAQTETFSGPFAYVTNQISNSVTVIDTPTNTVVTTIALTGCDGSCSTPAGLAVTPDGSRVYVANEGNGTVSVISTSTNTVSATITLPTCSELCLSAPIGVAITPDGLHAYVTDPGHFAIDVIDTNPGDGGTFNTVTTSITATTIISPFSIAITPNGAFAYATEFMQGSDTTTTNVNMISTATNAVVATIAVGNDPSGVAVNPNGSTVYVTNNTSGSVSVFAAGNTNPPSPSTITVGTGPYSVAFTPDGTLAYVVNRGADTVSVITTSTNTVASTISSGFCAVGQLVQIAITPNGTDAYVADAEAPGAVGCNQADVISTASNTVTTSLPVGSSPFGVAIGPATTNTVTVGPFAVAPGTTVNFIDGNFINQKVTIPPDAIMNNVATMQMSFIQVSPAVFNATRLTGVEGNTFSGGNQGPFISPPTTCTVITGTVDNSNCVVMEAQCFTSTGTALPTCAITAPTTLITLTTSYETPFPQPTPGFLIADDGENNWANILIAFDASAFNVNDPVMRGGTKSCQEDTVIVNLGGPVTPTPASVNFGNVNVFGFPIAVVTVTNTGSSALNIRSKLAAVPGGDSDDFGALSLCLRPLQPTKSCFILVSFFADPDDFNLQTATLDITNSAPGSPQLIVPLSATVVLPAKKH